MGCVPSYLFCSMVTYDYINAFVEIWTSVWLTFSNYIYGVHCCTENLATPMYAFVAFRAVAD